MATMQPGCKRKEKKQVEQCVREQEGSRIELEHVAPFDDDCERFGDYSAKKRCLPHTSICG